MFLVEEVIGFSLGAFAGSLILALIVLGITYLCTRNDKARKVKSRTPCAIVIASLLTVVGQSQNGSSSLEIFGYVVFTIIGYSLVGMYLYKQALKKELK
ncbi:hypothetical protein HGP28_02290 [Vibrio sp. SM6]|uniref:Uncharacterized protein n=1 Tax=Vibrio agarilyticus TaxID=2726741 RepID=A0A7X8TNH8_9VIBR|nr:hypothetical protein [Vibrio agarilyticus]NLS11717.1 hypothetical protein [Vibrio agarilyticus]